MSAPILVAYSPKAGDRGPINFAEAAAQATGAPLVVVAAGAGGDDAAGRLRSELGLAEGVDVRAVDGSAAKAITEVIEEVRPGLVVVGSTHRGGIGRVMASSTAEKVIHGVRRAGGRRPAPARDPVRRRAPDRRGLRGDRRGPRRAPRRRRAGPGDGREAARDDGAGSEARRGPGARPARQDDPRPEPEREPLHARPAHVQDALDAAIAELATGWTPSPTCSTRSRWRGSRRSRTAPTCWSSGPLVRADAQRHARRRLAQADRLRGMPGPRAAARHGGAHPDGRCRPLRSPPATPTDCGGHRLVGPVRGRLPAVAQPDDARGRGRRHVDVNGAYLRLTGYKREDLIGRPIWEFVAGGPLLSRSSGRPRSRPAGSPARRRWCAATGARSRSSGVRAPRSSRAGASCSSSRSAAERAGSRRTGRRRGPRAAAALQAREGGRPLRGARLHGARDRRRAAHLARHRAHARAQRHGEDGRALARAPRREGPGRTGSRSAGEGV